ncbi:hypothetical protein Landi51_02422 [Colletotrichum acutatum]
MGKAIDKVKGDRLSSRSLAPQRFLESKGINEMHWNSDLPFAANQQWSFVRLAGSSDQLRHAPVEFEVAGGLFQESLDRAMQRDDLCKILSRRSRLGLLALRSEFPSALLGSDSISHEKHLVRMYGVPSALAAAKSSGLKAQGRERWAKSEDRVIDNSANASTPQLRPRSAREQAEKAIGPEAGRSFPRSRQVGCGVEGRVLQGT